MKVEDAMSIGVVTVSPETSLKDVAELLVERRITGVPVCDEDGRLVGIVSQQDILYKELGPEERTGGPLAWLVSWPAVANLKASALTAGDTMTSPVHTIEPTRTVAVAARVMVERHVNRLPVVDHAGNLVGIVTRSDLVRAFARSDTEIAHEIEADVLERTLWIAAETIGVTVERGEVSLSGQVDRRRDAETAVRLAERVPGVVSVRSQLTWRDDNHSRPRRSAVTN